MDVSALAQRTGLIGRGPTPRRCPLDVGVEFDGPDERTHPSPCRLLRDWPPWLRFADVVTLVTTAFQPSSHRVSAPALAFFANDCCRADAQAERTLPLPSEKQRGDGPVQVRHSVTWWCPATRTHAPIGSSLPSGLGGGVDGWWMAKVWRQAVVRVEVGVNFGRIRPIDATCAAGVHAWIPARCCSAIITRAWGLCK